MKIYNIAVKKTYTGKDGQEKTQWLQVGRMAQFPATTEKSEGFKLELNMFPETKFFVFEQKPREPQPTPPAPRPTPVPTSSEEINVEEIPF